MAIILVLLSIFGYSYAFNLNAMKSLERTQQILDDERIKSDPTLSEDKIVEETEYGMYVGRQSSICYNVSNSKKLEVFASEKNNNFLDMMNFMEFVQTTETRMLKNSDAIKYYNVSIAAMHARNTFVAQENVARALSTIENVKARRKRDVSYNNIHTWDATNLFNDFREQLGDENFKELLHLNKRVTIAFVIDTSSSMENDMDQVRDYIDQILDEQRKAGVDALYIVNTFADPLVGTPTLFSDPSAVSKHVRKLRTKIGGDCEERTCYGMLRAISSPIFHRYRNAALFVFTDAGSKDCLAQGDTIITTLTLMRASAYFILFDSCKPNIDSYYVKIAKKTGGFCLMIKENGVYNITDTVNGAFENDALIFGEHSDTANSIVGQGVTTYRSKRAVDTTPADYFTTKRILIDTSIEHFRITAQIKPTNLQDEIVLEKPKNAGTYCDDTQLQKTRSTADDTVIIDVKALQCPCTGEWSLKYPRESESFSYSIKSAGEFLVSFESYFVDEVDYNRIANYAPCLGKEEYLVIKLNQGEKVNIESLTAKLVAVAGNEVRWEGRLAKDTLYKNTFVVKLEIPMDIGSDGFRVMLEGEIVDGTKFQRISTAYFYPTASCFRIVNVDNYYALFPNRKTYIEIEITNNDEVDEAYSVICSNTQNYDVFIGAAVLKSNKRKQRAIFSNPMYLKSKESLSFRVTIKAPGILKNGRTVTVTCKSMTTTNTLIEMIRLTEMRRRL